MERLFHHIENGVFHNIAEKVQTRSDGFGGTKVSRVLLQESAQKLREMHEKFSVNSQGFKWHQGQKTPPLSCPDLECLYIPGTEQEEGDSDEEASVCAEKTQKCKRVKIDSIDHANSLEMCYGIGFEDPHDALKITPNLCLSRIFNLLWLLPYHYPGFHSTYLYYGGRHSFFPVHVEDALTWSLNYLFLGHPKVW